MRGPLAPAGVPLARSRSQEFDDLVLDAVEHLEHRWSEQLADVEFAVEDVPPAASAAATGAEEVLADEGPVPLARLSPASRTEPARIVLYRRPLEVRGGEPERLAALVHDVVVEQVARLLGVDPDEVDRPPDP